MYHNKGEFLPLWDTKEEVFLLCGIQTENNLRMIDNFSSVVFHNAVVFLPLYPTPQKNLLCSIVQTEGSIPLWDTKEEYYTMQNDSFKF
jgi:hypothetical protein